MKPLNVHSSSGSSHAVAACILTTTLLLNGCAGVQSSLDPAGPEAESINKLLWLMIITSTVVFVLVIGFLAYAVLLARRRNSVNATREAERRMTTNVSVAASFTVIILFALLMTSVFTGRALTSKPGDEVLKIEVTGLQWWWDVRYDDPIPARMVKTANEIHIPTGRLVLLKLTSHDVIHSFWAPNLAGKKDLIPGHHTTLFFQADKRGIFRGQCAEFCGHQHAHMAFNVVVESPEEFESWYTRQLQTSPAPSDETQTRGQQVFLTSRCVMCHSIAGTSANATTGPDLTHIASRLTIAAGTLPNTPEHLASWIRDSQSIKPGNKMPRIELSDEELHALVGYLETLK